MEAFEILVIILSIALAVFLIIGIMVAIEAYKVTRKLNDLSDKANQLADDVGDAVLRTFKKSITPSVIAAAFMRARNMGRKSKKD